MGVLQKRQVSCSSGYTSWSCSPTSTQQAFNGCCKSDPCANGGICPDTNQNCDETSGYLPWVCQQTLTQKAYTGCCKIDACANGGSCPISAQPGGGSGSASTSTRATSRTQSATSSSQSPTPVTTLTGVIIVPGISSSLSTTDSNTSDSALNTATGTQPLSTGDAIVITTRITRTVVSTDASGIARTTTVTNTGVFSGGGPDATGTPTTTGLAPTHTSSPSSKTAIIGGAVGGGIALLLLLLIAILCLRRRKRAKEQNMDQTYGAAYSEKPRGFLGILPFGRNNDNRNSMSSVPASPKRGFFASMTPFRNHPVSDDPHVRRDHKVPQTPNSPLPPQGITEMPSPSFPPPAVDTDPPYDYAEMESDTVTAPSELSASTPLQGNRGSGISAWGATPEPRGDVSNTSTTAVLSPARETHYSDASSAGSMTGSGLSGASHNVQGGYQPPLRGGGLPAMRPNLNSVRRPVPNRQQNQGQSSASASAGQASGSGGVRHVLSFMDYEAEGGTR